jgi:protein arginine kinase activator
MAALVQSPHSIPNVEERKCACCHLKLSSFTSKGRLGCPSCYQAFEKEVEELLQHLHGTTEHRGKQYQAGAGSRVAQGDLSQLTVELDSAIKNEEFERAALLRDAIHGLKNTEGK